MSPVKLQVYLSVCFMFLLKQRSSSYCYVMLSCYFTTIFALTFSNILPGFSSLHIFLIPKPFSHFFFSLSFTHIGLRRCPTPRVCVCVSLFFFSTQALVLHNCSGLLVFLYVPEPRIPLLPSNRLGGQNCARNVVAWRLITARYMVASKQP